MKRYEAGKGGRWTLDQGKIIGAENGINRWLSKI